MQKLMLTIGASRRHMNGVVLVAAVALLIAAITYPTSAQQNGTSCPESISNGPDTMYLTLDAVCDGSGNPQNSPYGGNNCWYGPCSHDGCFSGPGYGQNVTCDPCPSNWQNCTPCPDYASNCGEDTPDPQPTPE